MMAKTMHSWFMQAKHFCITKHRDREHDKIPKDSTFLTYEKGVKIVTTDGKFVIV